MNLQRAYVREHVTLKRLQPLLLVVLVPPCLAVSRNHVGRCLPECGYASCLAPLEDRIEPKLDPGADLPRPLPGCRERDFRSTHPAKVTPVAVLLHQQHPPLASARLNPKKQTAAIATPPRARLLF